MINPIALGQTVEFIMPADKTNPTIWILGPIDSLTKMKLFNFLAPMEKTQEKEEFTPRVDPLQFNLELVRFGLVGFKNFKLNGKEVGFKTTKITRYGEDRQVVSDETLRIIPVRVLNALANKILEQNEVSEEERKNF